MHDFEKLGQFYLGREYDLENDRPGNELLLYDSKDLTTHAVVVGMTGSGKTGLCLGLLEEAAMDRIPAIVIDPKGDIANLALTFPDLNAKDFRPWVDESQAIREGVTADQFAASEATKWRQGLESWGQDGERIQRMKDTVETRIYTPGSNAGRPVTILKSFDAPSVSVLEDSDALRERISSATSGLLALLGIDADPIRSREHILISNILDRSWRDGQNLDLGQLIGQIQNPPFERVGVMELDTFFPPKDRMTLAMTLNNLLASPSFSSWMSGETLNIKRLLHTAEGKPCVSIMSIAHLNDNERMFFVTILLNEILSWMRTQSGTSSLRAILYMDEVFGYFPPTRNPPSKQPMLTMLKQARAYGLGIVLATQNPVDLDYKGLSNTGTWFLGRLQTERDKARVLEGLEGAAAQSGSNFDRRKMEEILAGLGSRKFLMNNVHEDEPVIFETRWAMSYLRGPLTRNQIQQLVEENDPGIHEVVQEAVEKSQKEVIQPPKIKEDPRLLIPPDVEQRFVTISQRIEPDTRLVYRPCLLATGRLHYVRASYKIDYWTEKSFLTTVREDMMPDEVWENSELLPDQEFEFDREAGNDAEFAEVPKEYFNARNYKIWNKELKSSLYRDHVLTVWKCTRLKLYSEANETLGDFKVRIEQKVSELRDAEVEKLRKKYASKFRTAKDRIRRAEDKVEVETEQYEQSRTSSWVNIGQTIMGAVLGRRTSRSAGTSIRSYGRASKEKADIGRAQDNLKEVQERYEDLEVQFDEDVAGIEEKLDVENMEFEELTLAPRKSDILIEDFCLCWMPWKVDSAGIAEPVY